MMAYAAIYYSVGMLWFALMIRDGALEIPFAHPVFTIRITMLAAVWPVVLLAALFALLSGRRSLDL